MAVAEWAYESYGDRHSQTLERINERGGFGWGELACYIATTFTDEQLRFYRLRHLTHDEIWPPPESNQP